MNNKVARIFLGLVMLIGGLLGCQNRNTQNLFPSLPVSQSPGSTIARSQSFTSLEGSIHQQVNQYRQSQNLPSLTLNSAISAQARKHSEAMAQGQVPFSHEGFKQRIEAISNVISYRSAGENVAFNQGYSDPATVAVRGWLKSPGHLKNIQGQFDLTGIGVAKNSKGEYYFTQIFLKKR